MIIKKILRLGLFKIRLVYIPKYFSFRTSIYRFQGLKTGKGTVVGNARFTWPHQVKIGDSSRFEHDVYFHYDGIYSDSASIIIGNNVFVGYGVEFNIRKAIHVGNNCLIASGCKFIDHDHGMAIGSYMNSQIGTEDEIYLEDDVWLGVNVVVLKGVTIGEGAVIAANAVVTKSIPKNEVWAGIPAKKVKDRL
ncbi:galactoside acetyltransferase (lacA) [Zunongwangia profunda SM-A87]|uniref:Galactoside acetyltransferase (LacA) n=1 Tax=Zunongwangia profunda (strain DSM 18752 / CCTCC AB 206139 / SM-A87) TaxID=655815 RepID=D5BFG1_ZUNPS|nr:acyltransferase [Zunongwangia profunda]ADF50905.1 galactoside acetyltransferase (lacA) [Zunongwangia profunda SM-A87]